MMHISSICEERGGVGGTLVVLFKLEHSDENGLKGEIWKCLGAVYGKREAPQIWQEHFARENKAEQGRTT